MTDKNQTLEESNDPRIGACVYLIHGLLQRLEKQQAGLLAEITLGAASDRAAMNPERSLSEKKGCEIADEALRMLRLMTAQMTLASQVPDNS